MYPLSYMMMYLNAVVLMMTFFTYTCFLKPLNVPSKSNYNKMNLKW